MQLTPFQEVTRFFYEVAVSRERLEREWSGPLVLRSSEPIRRGATTRVLGLDAHGSTVVRGLAEIVESARVRSSARAIFDIALSPRGPTEPVFVGAPDFVVGRRPALGEGQYLALGPERVRFVLLELSRTHARVRLDYPLPANSSGMLCYVSKRLRLLVPFEIIHADGVVATLVFSHAESTMHELVERVRLSDPAVLILE